MLALLKLLPVGAQIGLAAAAFTLVSGGVWYTYHTIYQRGYDAAMQDIADANAEAKAEADKRVGLVRDCRARGLRWDTTTGKCS